MKDNPSLKKDDFYVRKVRANYQKCGSRLRLSKRTIEAFEYRYGLIDGKFHTFNATGKRLRVTDARARQLVMKVIYEMGQDGLLA